MDMSDLEDSSGDSDEDNGLGLGRGRGRRSKNKLKKTKNKYVIEDYVPKDGEVLYGCWSRPECFKVERGLLTYGYVLFYETITEYESESNLRTFS